MLSRRAVAGRPRQPFLDCVKSAQEFRLLGMTPDQVFKKSGRHFHIP
jgi:hypothetical protein